MMTHTPGPWTVSICGKRDEVVTVVADGAPVADVVSTRSVGEAHANADLLAAAPDLLAALEFALPVLQSSADLTDAAVRAYRGAVAAINRAKAVQP